LGAEKRFFNFSYNMHSIFRNQQPIGNAMVANSVSKKSPLSSSSAPPPKKSQPNSRSMRSSDTQPNAVTRFAKNAKDTVVNAYQKSGIAKSPMMVGMVGGGSYAVRSGLASKALSLATKNPWVTAGVGTAIAGTVLWNKHQSQSKGSSVLMQENSDGTAASGGDDTVTGGSGSKPQPKTHQEHLDAYNESINQELLRQRVNEAKIKARLDAEQ
jgi:hypothetical protein